MDVLWPWLLPFVREIVIVSTDHILFTIAKLEVDADKLVFRWSLACEGGSSAFFFQGTVLPWSKTEVAVAWSGGEGWTVGLRTFSCGESWVFLLPIAWGWRVFFV
jgi:hypothetical protein